MLWDGTGCYGIFEGGVFLEFTDFGTRLYDVASSNMQRGDFCRMLFDNITDLSTADGDPLDLEADTYRKYLRGASPITKLAKSINAYIETTVFIAYIEHHPEGVIGNIAKAFKDVFPDIDVNDSKQVAECIAELFEAIILDASKEPTPLSEDSGLDSFEKQSDTADNNETRFSNQLIDVSNSKIYYDPQSEMLYIGKSKMRVPKSIIPDEPEEHEMVYVNELLAAYSNTSSEKLTIATLKGKFKRDYLDQRINYFSALDVERFARETVNVGDEQVGLWKSDTFSYINSVLWGNFDDDFQRLMAVMARAVDAKTTSVIEKFENLINPAARKGVCHLLVTDGQMKWVDDDE